MVLGHNSKMGGVLQSAVVSFLFVVVRCGVIAVRCGVLWSIGVIPSLVQPSKC